MADSEASRAGTTPESDPRELTDPRVIRALAHPLRLSLFELLLREGQLTASRAGEILNESPANMSWHLQTMARYGFVEEAEGGRGRARPWRLVSAGNRFGEDLDDPEQSVAAETLARLFHERALQQLRRWEDERHAYPTAWQAAAFTSELLTYLEAAELDALGRELTAILARYRERATDRMKRPKEALPVHLVTFGHPLPPTPSGN